MAEPRVLRSGTVLGAPPGLGQSASEPPRRRRRTDESDPQTPLSNRTAFVSPDRFMVRPHNPVEKVRFRYANAHPLALPVGALARALAPQPARPAPAAPGAARSPTRQRRGGPDQGLRRVFPQSPAANSGDRRPSGTPAAVRAVVHRASGQRLKRSQSPFSCGSLGALESLLGDEEEFGGAAGESDAQSDLDQGRNGQGPGRHVTAAVAAHRVGTENDDSRQRSERYRHAVMSETLLANQVPARDAWASPSRRKIRSAAAIRSATDDASDEETIPPFLQPSTGVSLQPRTLGTASLAAGTPSLAAGTTEAAQSPPLSLKATLGGHGFRQYADGVMQTPPSGPRTRFATPTRGDSLGRSPAGGPAGTPFGRGTRLFGTFSSLQQSTPLGAGHFTPRLEALMRSARKVPFTIPNIPYKVLDAPDLQDDFYLNLLDWSASNVLAVGLSACVYLWNAQSGSVTKLTDFGAGDTVTSLNWHSQGDVLAVGTSRGRLCTYDAASMSVVREWPSAAAVGTVRSADDAADAFAGTSGHVARIGALAWNPGPSAQTLLTSGSRDRHIIHRDVRAPGAIRRIGPSRGHRQEVCGLRWSVDGAHLASGGNDNRLFVWDGTRGDPLYEMDDHKAAIKALAWHPSRAHVLASGGGTADRHIRLWDVRTGRQDFSVDTGSQVCNVLFSRHSPHLVSTHGYSQNQIVVWKYLHSANHVRAASLCQLTGHSQRVLYLAMSPDGDSIVTGSGDETLRFWRVFGRKLPRMAPSSCLSSDHPSMQIR